VPTLNTKKIIKENFSKSAEVYDGFSDVQKLGATFICDASRHLIKDGFFVLDLGSGTGNIKKNLQNLEKKINLFEIDLSQRMLEKSGASGNKIVADIDFLPFKNEEKFDMIFSSFSLQWINNLEDFFFSINRILKKNGIIAICVPTYGSLLELTVANKKSGCNFYIKNFLREEEIIFFAKNFTLIKCYKKIINQPCDSGIAALKGLKKIGANYSEEKNFVSKNNLRKFNDFFKREANKNNISWHISFFLFQK
jgi:ubiquinone/menaquinone biosynthesis C-methylase UbiE